MESIKIYFNSELYFVIEKDNKFCNARIIIENNLIHKAQLCSCRFQTQNHSIDKETIDEALKTLLQFIWYGKYNIRHSDKMITKFLREQCFKL